MRSAVDHLELLGAVERREGQVLLTPLGKKMASFPLEPRYAKVHEPLWFYFEVQTGYYQLEIYEPITHPDQQLSL